MPGLSLVRRKRCRSAIQNGRRNSAEKSSAGAATAGQSSVAGARRAGDQPGRGFGVIPGKPRRLGVGALIRV